MVKLPTPDGWRFDKRTLAKTEKTTPQAKEFKAHLDALPDESANVEMVPIWEDKLTPPSRRQQGE